jgi:hypothetical protein
MSHPSRSKNEISEKPIPGKGQENKATPLLRMPRAIMRFMRDVTRYITSYY